MNLPFDPRQFPRSNRYLAGKRLRPLPVVLLTEQLRRLRGRAVKRRPRGWKGHWPHYAQRVICNGHQARRRRAVMDALRELRRLRVRTAEAAGVCDTRACLP